MSREHVSRGLTLGGARVLGLAALLLVGLASPALGQAAKQAPLYRVNGDPVVCTEYHDGQQRTYGSRTDWRYMCGSKTDGLTEQDLKNIALDHSAKLDPANPGVMVIDTPRGQGGFGDRGPGAVNVIFNINTAGMPAGAATSFTLAEQYIESKWANPITVTISVSWANLGGGVIGATGSNYVTGVSYSSSRAGLVAGMDANDTIQSFLPSGTSCPVRFNATSATISNVGSLNWTRANYRATVGAVSGSDCNMQFNSTFAFDFDPSNGVPANTLSLVDTIIHEVGHCMGFVSEADSTTTSTMNPLDLFRFARTTSTRAGVTNFAPTTTAQFQTFAREVDFNNPTNDDAETSLVSVRYRMSDGSPNQASHWFQQSFDPAVAIGIMQPVLNFTETFYPNYYKQADLDAFDAIGWSYAPCTSAPTIGTQPTAQTACTGTGFSLSVAATGGSIGYQWRKATVNIPGATGSTYSVVTASTNDAGSYDCVLTNGCGTATSNAVAVTINTPPTISTQPSAAFACPGSAATFSVAATGSGPFTYQWRKNGNNLNGATGPTYTIPAASVGDAGNYDCVVTNSCAGTPSNVAVLTVANNPVISNQPVDTLACAGQPTSLSVSAIGAGSIQWRKGGNDIPNANSSTYSILSASTADAGSYDCVLTNSCGSVTSNPVTLTVNTGPAVTGDPTPLTRCIGTSATFSVSATGTPAPSFQWRKGVTNIPGATSASFTIPSVAAIDGASYTCIVTNLCGSATSAAAVLTVQTPITFSLQPSPATVCEGEPVTLQVSASGTGPFTYRWRRNGTPVSGFGPVFSLSPALPENTGSYDCLVTGPCGAVPSDAAAVVVNGAPTITSEPQPVSGCTGSPAAFTVGASGAGTLSYQWQKNLVDIPGATSSTYSIASVSAANVGDYLCVVTNACGSTPSGVAALTLSGQPSISAQPAAATACEGSPASFTVAATGNGTLSYQWRKDTADISGATLATYSIPSVGAGSAGSYDCRVTDSCSSVLSNAAALTLNSGPSISGHPPATASGCSGTPLSLTVTATGTPAPTYQWRKDTAPIDGATGPTLTIPSLSAADIGSYDCVVTNSCSAATSTATAVTIDQTLTVTGQPSPVTVCAGQPASFSVTAAAATTFSWRKGGVALTDGPTGNGSVIAGAATASLSISNTGAGDAGSYDCILTSPCGPATSDAAGLVVNTAPAITTQPTAQRACLSGSATFTVAASGTGTLGYQWRKGGVNIPGQTGVSLTINPATVSAAGSYDCVVSNECGSTPSDAAVLTVCVGDFNCSGTVSVQDIFDFLAGYFAGDVRADVNASGAISVQDIFDFLAAYFAGCP